MNKSDIFKTLNYMKRNGIKKAVGAVYERLTAHYDADYEYQIPSEDELQNQRESIFVYSPLISILVPAYETDEVFFTELLESVVHQSYSNWELIIADASSSEKVKHTLEHYLFSLKQKEHAEGKAFAERISYVKLSGNHGISENTNEALRYAKGEYIGLLDHDDLLTPDLLFYLVEALNHHEKTPLMLYTDEDKCDETGRCFYEPNHKYDFNLDLLLSNNYICHFLLLESSLMKKLHFRQEFDGAQDFDLILRAVGTIKDKEKICHIPKVLYHWRCHSASTAANPASKLYAYEAGKRAITDFLKDQHISASVLDSEHVGFYVVEYEPDIFTARKEIAAVGGSLIGQDGKIAGGMLMHGRCPWQGMAGYFAGPRNLASVKQQCEALDARVMILRPAFWADYEQIIKIPYEENLSHRDTAFCNQLDEAVWKQRSEKLCKLISSQGFVFVWDPKLKIYRA